MISKICFFNSSNFWGGGEKLHLDYAIKLIEFKHQVVVFSNKNAELFNRAKKNNIQATHIKVNNLSFLNPFKIFYTALNIKKQKIDTIIFTTSQDVKFGSLAAKIAGVKNIVYIRGLAVPIKNSFVNRFIFKRVLTHFIANSLETKKQILKHLKNVLPENKIEIIYHGIENQDNKNEYFEPISKNQQEIILGNAGRLTEQKGQKHLIEIAKILKNKGLKFKIYIAGSGELFDELTSLITKENLQNEIILLGFVSEMDAFMNSIDIFLLTSIWEGFGFVLVEAMKKSKPIVAFNTSSNPEVVEHNVNGFLCPYPDLDCFAQKIIELANSESLRIEMGSKGNHILRTKFSIEKSSLDLIKYINTEQK